MGTIFVPIGCSSFDETVGGIFGKFLNSNPKEWYFVESLAY